MPNSALHTVHFTLLGALLVCGLATLAACSSDVQFANGGIDAVEESLYPPTDSPIEGLNAAQIRRFNEGDALFDLPMRAGDGLGPLYANDHCSGCHLDALRGPGLVRKMVAVEADGYSPIADQASRLPNGNTGHPFVAAPATTTVPVLDGQPGIKTSTRFGPPVIGRGYLEAIRDSELEAREREQALGTYGIRGRINRTKYASEANTEVGFHTHKPGDSVYGRFGVKARIATLDDFTADAFQGDMGITSPLRPVEISNPDGVRDDLKSGMDVGYESVNKRADYARFLAIPPRRRARSKEGAMFAQVLCSNCHTPTQRTRTDYPIAALADIDAPVFTDLLIHNMGTALADGTVEGSAGPRDWRTSPLIGLRYFKLYMHDGRAKTIREAILGHASQGSEANESIRLYNQLSASDQTTLDAYVLSL